ncbi:HlyD family secretion protein [Candidatus Laterigemmans baculatus]|uniref:HlyD family efflux transporter periplasmic adaptor subunit n=1 Tax=Candidatus Laterigemmans baculatus TaxID=2770505 RepID=UPI0013DA2EF7|nr:HlyD family efflux transporter periplasmic adaptor subunit [Candidatus Laterigemmans baculatus]
MEASSTTEPFRFSASSPSLEGRGAPHAPRPEADALVLETKREIRRLVQEIAALCHSRLSARQFWPRFLADVTSAMAAEGCVLWQLAGEHWASVAHHGHVDRRLLVPRLSPGDSLEPVRSGGTNRHWLMIREVAHGGGPMVVPPSGDWTVADAETAAASDDGNDAVEPGNPTEFLAAVVPIPVDLDQPVEWMMELFLPVGGGPATQRGYLRFAAQMADLAADFLRRERLRAARAHADQAARMHESVLTLYRSTDRTTAESRIVDAAARVFSAERVSLVRRRGGSWRVVAVSGVDQIDPALPAVQAIRELAAGLVAASPTKTDGSVGFIPAGSAPETSGNIPDAAGAEPVEAEPAEAEPDAEGEASEGALVLRGVAIVDAAGQARLVVEDRAATEVDPEQQHRWSLFLQHTDCVLTRLDRTRQPGLRGWIAARGERLRNRLGRSVVVLAIAVGGLLLAALPVPLIVTADARLEPRQVQNLYAPRDSVIDEIWVDHGAAVEPGEPVLRLVDLELDRSINSLLGRRAVLSERLAEIRTRVVGGSTNDPEETERLQTEQQIAGEELRSIAAELAVLEQERERLVLRSDRSGIVDAWQIRERLGHRPVGRGQMLFRIVAPEGGWLIEADVPQNRLDHLVASRGNGPVEGTAVLAAFPDHAVAAQLEDIGPAAWPREGSPSLATAASGPDPTGTVTFSLDADRLPLKQPGAPVKLGIDCGHRPLAYVACQDLVRTVVGWLRLYL